MLHKHSLKASRNCLQSNPLTRTALGPVITSIHLVRVSTYPYLYFTQCVQMGPNKLYTFTWVIHLSGIHLERFGCTYIHRYGKSQNLNLNKIIRHETKAKPNWQPRQNNGSNHTLHKIYSHSRLPQNCHVQSLEDPWTVFLGPQLRKVQQHLDPWHQDVGDLQASW